MTPEARRTMKSELGLVGTQTAPLRLQGRINTMKHLLTGVAVVAALAFSAPVWAQPASPSGGNPMGVPGPSPGWSGTDAIHGGRTGPAHPGLESTSAMPPKHRHAHHVASTPMLHRARRHNSTGRYTATSSIKKSLHAFRRETFPIRRSSRLIPCHRCLPRLPGAGCPQGGGQHRQRRRTDRKARTRGKGVAAPFAR